MIDIHIIKVGIIKESIIKVKEEGPANPDAVLGLKKRIHAWTKSLVFEIQYCYLSDATRSSIRYKTWVWPIRSAVETPVVEELASDGSAT